MLTTFEYNKPITILGSNRNLLIPYALLVQEEQSTTSLENDQFAQEALTHKQFVVYLPDKEIPKILDQKKLVILPYGKNYQLKKKRSVSRGRSYEISI